MDHATDTSVVPGQGGREGGCSFLEATVASIMMLLLAWLIATLSVDGMRAQRFAERTARVTEIAQDVIDDMRRGLGSAVRVFGSDLVGSAYRDTILLGAQMPAPVASSRLPLVVASAMLDLEDPALPRTGNELFFARYAWTDEFTTTSANSYRVDVYRLERWYLTNAGAGPREGMPDGLNLSRWISEPLADGSQVDRIEDATDRAEVLTHLFAGTPDATGVARDPVEVAWLVGEPPATTGTFRALDSSGGLSLTAPSNRPGGWRIMPSTRLSDPDILIYRHHSVSTNFAPGVFGVGRFGILDLADGFPHGLEVQVVGTAASRKILLHLSICSTLGGGRRAYHDMQVVVDVRDL